MEESSSLFVLVLAAFLLLVGFLSARLWQANQRVSTLYSAYERDRRLVLFHLEHLEAQLRQMPNVAIVWDTGARAWEFKGRLGAEGLAVYLGACRKFAQSSLAAGEDRQRIDATIRLSLQRLTGRDFRYYEELTKLLSDQERASWLSAPTEGPKQ